MWVQGASPAHPLERAHLVWGRNCSVPLKDLDYLVSWSENSSDLHSFYPTFCFAELKRQKNIICSLPEDLSSNIVSERAIKSELEMNCGQFLK